MDQGMTEDQQTWRAAFDQMRRSLSLREVDPGTYSPLSLAYIGDDVYDLVFRTIAVSRVNMAAHKYHAQVTGQVSAVAQSRMVEAIEDDLSEEERRIYLRGRNSKPFNKAKNATSEEYQKATGLEALVGYLYLKGDMPRIFELITLGLEHEKERN